MAFSTKYANVSRASNVIYYFVRRPLFKRLALVWLEIRRSASVGRIASNRARCTRDGARRITVFFFFIFYRRDRFRQTHELRRIDSTLFELSGKS